MANRGDVLGKIVEKCESKDFSRRSPSYTKALLSATPGPKSGGRKGRIILKGEISSPINPEEKCRFFPRCVYAKEKCGQNQPELREVSRGHFVACHYHEEINGVAKGD